MCEPSCNAKPTAGSNSFGSAIFDEITTVVPSVYELPLVLNLTGMFLPVTILTKLAIALR